MIDDFLINKISISQGLKGGISLLFSNNGWCLLILIKPVRENFGEVDVAWCGRIGNCKGGGCTWGGIAGCWYCVLCQVSKIVIVAMFTVCPSSITLTIT